MVMSLLAYIGIRSRLVSHRCSRLLQEERGPIWCAVRRVLSTRSMLSWQTFAPALTAFCTTTRHCDMLCAILAVEQICPTAWDCLARVQHRAINLTYRKNHSDNLFLL